MHFERHVSVSLNLPSCFDEGCTVDTDPLPRAVHDASASPCRRRRAFHAEQPLKYSAPATPKHHKINNDHQHR
jgi:hypothetical protein